MASQLTEEDLKKMSPEEIAALQKQNCIFCHIISGKVPAKKLYEDKDVIAILDIYPAAHGHILLLPKEHHAIMPQVPENVIRRMGMLSKALSLAALKGLGAKSTNIFIANGAVAGQRAAHFMIHIIPRNEKDNLNFNIPENKITDVQLEKVRSIVIKRLAELMKKTEKELVRDYEPSEPDMNMPSGKKKSDFGKAEEKGAPVDEKKSKKKDGDEEEDIDEEEKPAKKKAPEKKKGKKSSDEDDEEKEEVTLDDVANLFS